MFDFIVFNGELTAGFNGLLGSNQTGNMSKVQKDKTPVQVQGSSKAQPKATEKWSFRLIKHCYENDYEIPDRDFLTELDDYAMGCHNPYRHGDISCDEILTDEEEFDCEATQVIEE